MLLRAPRPWFTLPSTLLLGAVLAACAGAPTTSPSTAPVLNPPAAMQLLGVPPVPASMAQRVGAYTEVRGAGLVDWHPDGQGLIVNWRGGNTSQLHLARAGQPLQLLTPANEPTRSGRMLPAQPDLLLFERDSGGAEAAQILRRSLSTGTETRLTDPLMRHAMGPFSRDGRRLAFTSVPLDRTATGGTRAQVETLVSTLDPVSGQVQRLAALPGPGWWVSAFSRDDRQLLLTRYKSNTEAEVWTLDIGSTAPRQLLPRAGQPVAAYFASDYAADGRRVMVTTDAFGEYRHLYRFDPADGRFERAGDDLPWELDNGSDHSDDGRRLALLSNEAGRGVLRLVDGQTLAALPTPTLPGHMRRVRFSPDGQRLAVWHEDSDTPGSVSVLDLASGRLTPWVMPDLAGLSGFQRSEIIHWTSFDGRRISGLMTRPPARFTGPRPVLVDIHGGPASQSRPGFNGRANYLVNELGIVLIEPNVRGSAGFGKTFIALDDGVKREDSVKDIGALLDWVAAQPGLDAKRVAVSGGSYGGYMSQAVALHYGERIRAAINIVGISHFVSFLERTESYRRDLRRVEYGDERVPEMRAFLDRISPLSNAARLRTPMFVIHGRNDPRVPVNEAEQLVATLQREGVPVWRMIADNEGHGFAKKENADYAFYARVMFLEQWLLK